MSPKELAATTMRVVLSELAEVRGRLQDLAAEIASESSVAGAAPSRPTLALLAVDLHSYYTLLEGLIQRLVLALEGDAPRGPASHVALARHAMRPVEGVRPALVAPERAASMDELRRFRHFFRHGYALDLRYDRMRGALDVFADLHAGLLADLDRLEAFLRDLIAEIEEA